MKTSGQVFPSDRPSTGLELTAGVLGSQSILLREAILLGKSIDL